MRIEVDLHIHEHPASTEIAQAIARIEAALVLLTTGVSHMSGELDQLEAQVAAEVTVDQSAITLLNGLSAQIAALKNDPVKLQALADTLNASSTSLAAAVAANTPPAA